MRPESFRPPLTLRGRDVELVPLEVAHAAALWEAGRDPEVSRYLVQAVGPALEDVRALIEDLLARQAAGTDLPFSIRPRAGGAPIGATRFLRIDRENDAVEIGGTFLARSRWRTPANTDAKLTLLRHAFEVEGAHRVTLQTDLRNERSQRAIARLGATREAVHREDRHLASGYYRSSVVYAIVADEWPRVRARLEGLLERRWPPA